MNKLTLCSRRRKKTFEKPSQPSIQVSYKEQVRIRIRMYSEADLADRHQLH